MKPLLILGLLLLGYIAAKTHIIMSKISEFATRLNDFQERQGKAIDGLKTDVTDLKSKIEQLQSTPGTLTPEDQALLDGIEARAQIITDKLTALDDETPPTPPSE